MNPLKLNFAFLLLTLSGVVGAQAPNALETARHMVRKIGIEGSGKCNSCHGASLSTARLWSNQAARINYDCIKKDTLTPIERVNCLRSNPLDPNSPFTANRLGFLSVYTRSEIFLNLFRNAYPNDPALAKKLHEELVSSASMPPEGSGEPTFEGKELEDVIKWTLDFMPMVDAVIKPEPEKPCAPFISDELKDHILKMKTSGWSAKNQENGMSFFGCGVSLDPLDCFEDIKNSAAEFGNPAYVQNLKVIHKRDKRSYFWFRGSPDGRYLGFGGTYGRTTSYAEMVDMALANKPGANSVVSFDDATDPSFLPDNTGFSFTGLERPIQSLCKMSVIQDGLVTPGTRYKLRDNQKCANDTEGWYNSWGASLDNLSYWMIAGNFIADDAQYSSTNPIPASSNYRTDIIRLNEMKNDGLSYKAGRAAGMSVKGLVDMIVSPSAIIMNNRFGANATQSGFQLRSIVPEFSEEGGSLHFKKVGEYCGFGSKANFSFDERFLTFHQYPEPWRAGEPELPGDTSNVVVLDLLTGVSTRITQVPAGYKALFPHFRSDGWIYFILREPGDAREQVMASDFAIRAALAPIAYR